ncbi:MAG TPA: hypothetical protein VEQ59_01550, partial [Polyangiaceae bacterium]|nr:hypothetical protein [Polyangiaceae bacterium]
MVDDSLSSRASSVIKAGRRGLKPTDQDRLRVEAALRSRLGLRALPTNPAATEGARGLAWSLMGGAAVGLCVA